MILLDSSIDRKIRDRIRKLIEANGDDSRIADLHLWQIGSDNIVAIISIVTGIDHSVKEYHRRLSGKIDNLKHVSIEVNQCEECNENTSVQ